MLTITPSMYRELADPIKQAELLDQIEGGNRIAIKESGSWNADIIGEVCDACEGMVILEPDDGIAETYALDSYLLADCTIEVW